MALSTRRLTALAAPALTLCVALLSGCATGAPPPVSSQELAYAETFPDYRLYWAGRHFLDHPVTGVDGGNYEHAGGQSVYYGDCLSLGGLLGEGACRLPLRVTTEVYVPHPNAPLGPQRNTVIREVPATIYNEGRSIKLYSGHLVITVSASTAAHALAAVRLLRPLNAPGQAAEALPEPTFCPGLSGPLPARVAAVIARVRSRLPPSACPPRSPGAARPDHRRRRRRHAFRAP